jgi:hypothetical protein
MQTQEGFHTVVDRIHTYLTDMDGVEERHEASENYN